MALEDQRQRLEKILAVEGKGRLTVGSKLTSPDPSTDRELKITPLEKTVPGKVVGVDPWRRYHISRSLRQIWPAAGEIIDHYAWSVLGSGQALVDQSEDSELVKLTKTCPDRVIYLDIESCGFAGTVVFLVGWCYYNDAGDFIIEQMLARDYSEEAGIIAATRDRLHSAHVLVTYNGKRFDMPAIRERGLINRIRVDLPSCHIDLLDHARSRWKSTLPNCRLQTVETFLCRRHRSGDIPSSQIPQVYHDFVRTGDARKLSMVIQHNMFDVVTLAQIAAHIISGTQPGE